MKKSILVVAVGALSVLAVAQSDKKTDAKQPDSTVSAREASSGKATGKTSGVSNYDIKKVEGARQAAPQGAGKVTPEKMEAGSESIKKVDVSTNQPSKKTAEDDWQAKQAATGNGNGTQVTAPRDAASGMASGKRQHQPMLVNKVEDEKKPQAQPKK